MRIEIDSWTVTDLQEISTTVEAAGWGTFLIWVGMALLAQIGWGGFLVGTGIITLGVQAARWNYELWVDRFGFALGIMFILAGIVRMMDVQIDETQVMAWLIPAIFIAVGFGVLAYALLRQTEP